MRAFTLLRHARGAALMDLVTGLMIFAIAASGIFAGFKASLTAWTTAQQFTGEQHNARLVLDWLARRIRSAGTEYAGGPAVAQADQNAIVFYGYRDPGGAGFGRVQCHRIYVGGNVVYINTTEASGPPPAVPADCSAGSGQPLSTNVEASGFSIVGLTFRYFDDAAGAGSEITSLPITDPLVRSTIRRVRVTIRAMGLQTPGAFSMSTDVAIR
jgi:hypothetical protein